MSGNLLKLSLDEVCKQHYLAGQPGLWVRCKHSHQAALPPYSCFFPSCCYCKVLHICKQFYITGLSKKLSFVSVLYSALLALSFESKIAIIFLIIFLCSTYMFPLAFLEIWEADGPNEGWIRERVILMDETSEYELSRKRSRH